MARLQRESEMSRLNVLVKWQHNNAVDADKFDAVSLLKMLSYGLRLGKSRTTSLVPNWASIICRRGNLSVTHTKITIIIPRGINYVIEVSMV